jgi:small subunit ribosomal protein S2
MLTMAEIQKESRSFLESLIHAGIHWGHQKSRRNPKMDYYIWGYKNNVSLFDVSKTAMQLENAGHFLEKLASEGKSILWVGTKKPAQEAIKAAATQLNMPWVTHRWIGGTLSNYPQIKKLVTKLMHYEDVLAKAEKHPHYTKKELGVIQKEVARLEKNAGGIRNLAWPVGAIVLIDILKERAALREAHRMGVPIIALVDTNADPSLVDYVIPGNDDAPRAIKLVVDYLAQATQKGAEVATQKAIEKPQGEAEIPAEPTAIALIEATGEEEGEGAARAAKAGGLRKRSFEDEASKARGRGPRPRMPIKGKKD